MPLKYNRAMIQRLRRLFLAGSFSLLALIFVCNAIVFWSGIPGIFLQDLEKLPSAPVAIVLGAGMKADGEMSDQQLSRIETALLLFRTSKITKILVTGEAGQKKYDEVNPMKNFLTTRGVPQEAILVDPAGFDTYDSLYRAKNVYGFSEAVIITHYYHLPRAIFLARRLQMQATGFAADRRRYKKWWYVETREMLARVKAVFNALAGSKPEITI